MRRVRVLVTDDSLFMRAAIKKKDGAEAVRRVEELRPDVVTMDFNMPVLDGPGAVRAIMHSHPTPVIMLSAHTTDGARETFDALAAGAVDFLAKPGGEVSADFVHIGPALIAKVLAVSEATPAALAPAPRPELKRTTLPPGALSATPRVVVVAVSTGGPAALGRLLPRLPHDISFGLLIVQHMPTGFTAALAERLDALCAIRVREARHGDRPEPALALVAPGDHHLEVAPDGTLAIVDGAEVNGVRPSADVTMRAAARAWGRRAIGVVMTGMGRDGAEGLREIKRVGGTTLAQDRASCVVYGMPRAAVELGAVDKTVPLDGLAEALQQTVSPHARVG
jgi:two-component system chemotaxis response regulator CheB